MQHQPNDDFPRGKNIPSQSPIFWVMNKDRYLRQLLIRDIEEQTNRKLLVYFANCDANSPINTRDDIYLAELIKVALQSNSIGRDTPIDLMLETNGGMTDATEKVCALLRQSTPDLRVIVPRRAKSNGTVIALCGSAILMGIESELGPIDPSIGGIAVEFVLNAPAGTVSPIDFQMAATARKQTEKLARHLLSTGMMQDCAPAIIDETISKLATRNHYHSHGSVVDTHEAKALGLKVLEHDVKDLLWQRIWLLRTMYEQDCSKQNHAKIFESSSVSIPVEISPPTN